MADAWDDDPWIKKADSKSATPDPPPSSAKLSKAERRAKQAEFNRQIWEDAEKEDDNYFLKTQGIVPLKSEFKPAMTVLSRKPPTKIAKAADGIGQLVIDDDDEDDEASKNVTTAEERKQKAQREREEKQRAYEERRRELFGNPTKSNSSGRGGGSPRNQSRASRGESRPTSSASSKPRQLFDPNESAKPDSLRPQKMDPRSNDVQPIREPKAPDGSGRGGFGFAPRGGHSD